MLKNLYIRNFVIIEQVNIEFDSGFNVITGETGAGKSILINALEILIGNRLDKKAIGAFADSAMVEGSFYIDSSETKQFLLDNGYPPEEDLIIISRKWGRNGNSENRLNGRIVTATIIKKIMNHIIDIHGQNQNQMLLKKDNYYNLLDDYQRERTQPLLEQIKSLLAEIHHYEEELNNISVDKSEIDRELDIINYQLEEIDELNLEEIDETAIDTEYDRLSRMETVKENLAHIHEKLSGFDPMGNILDQLNTLSQNLSTISDFDSVLKESSDELEEVHIVLEEISNNISRFHDNLYYNEERQFELESIFSVLTKLKRKYGADIEKILQFKEELEKRKTVLLNVDENRKILQKKLDQITQKAYTLGKDLSIIRQEIAKIIERKVTNNLKDLNMLNAEFSIQIEKQDELHYNGLDKVDFLLKTNKGQDFNSLSKIASGGEVSRIMLGFKEVFAEADPTETLIFDEIDAGISGRTAQIVGEKLVDLANKFQVISISHLPQIASLADRHILIEKKDIEEKTISNLYIIEEEERTEEIARLIGGVDITNITRMQAEEMLEQAISMKKERKV